MAKQNELDSEFLNNGSNLLINNNIATFGICTVEIAKMQQEIETEEGVQVVEPVLYGGTLQTDQYIEFIDTIRFGDYLVYGVDVNREVISSNQVYVHYEFTAQGVVVVTEDMLEQEAQQNDGEQ